MLVHACIISSMCTYIGLLSAESCAFIIMPCANWILISLSFNCLCVLSVRLFVPLCEDFFSTNTPGATWFTCYCVRQVKFVAQQCGPTTVSNEQLSASAISFVFGRHLYRNINLTPKDTMWCGSSCFATDIAIEHNF